MLADHSVTLSRLMTLLAALVLGLVVPWSLWAQANLENPRDGSFQSGMGIISGWHCNAGKIEIIADGTIRVQVPYGVPRADTREVCGGAINNGFGLHLNWNNLGDGQHLIQVLADGVEFARAMVTVTTLETDFL